MSRAISTEKRLVRLVRQICAVEQPDVVTATEDVLRVMLNSAVALGHMRRFPELAADAVTDSILRTPHLKTKGSK